MGGRDKALMTLAGEPLLAHAVARLAPQVASLALSANGDASRFARFDLPVLADNALDQGPLAGILAGLDWAAAQGAEHLVTVAVDTPFFPCDLVPRLLLAAEIGGAAAAIAESHGRAHPTFALWPVGAASAVREALGQGERKLMVQEALTTAARATWDDILDPFFNINTEADLATAKVYLKDSA